MVAFEDDGLKFFTLHSEPLENPFSRVVKRAIDLAIALPAVCVILPIAAVLVKIVQLFQSPGPLFFHQTRSGIQNRRFEILKFRTMHPDKFRAGETGHRGRSPHLCRRPFPASIQRG